MPSKLEVADPTIGGKYQEDLAREALKVAREYAPFYLKALMQDGFLPGTLPPKNAEEAVVQGLATAQALVARAQMGEVLTEREQRFLMDWFDARSKLNGQRAA